MGSAYHDERMDELIAGDDPRPVFSPFLILDGSKKLAKNLFAAR
jgi:hypothetical protein